MARRVHRTKPDCPLRGAGKPLLLALIVTVGLVVSSLVLQGLGVLSTDGPQDGMIGDAPSPPPRSTLLSTAPPSPAPRATPPAPAPRPTVAGELVEVVRVVDGDTARVILDGEELTLRFIGLDTPETVHPSKGVECFGPEASAEAKRFLPPGAKVRIHYDPTQERIDYYGRTLVYLTGPAGLDFAEHMISMGYGHEYRYRKDYQRMDTYRAAQANAKEAGRGLWSACPTG